MVARRSIPRVFYYMQAITSSLIKSLSIMAFSRTIWDSLYNYWFLLGHLGFYYDTLGSVYNYESTRPFWFLYALMCSTDHYMFWSRLYRVYRFYQGSWISLGHK